jgi:hypothetical protein
MSQTAVNGRMDTLLVGAQALRLKKIVQQPDGNALFVSSKQSVVLSGELLQPDATLQHSRKTVLPTVRNTISCLLWS